MRRHATARWKRKRRVNARGSGSAARREIVAPALFARYDAEKIIA